jgi:hypothetical protein
VLIHFGKFPRGTPGFIFQIPQMDDPPKRRLQAAGQVIHEALKILSAARIDAETVMAAPGRGRGGIHDQASITTTFQILNQGIGHATRFGKNQPLPAGAGLSLGIDVPAIFLQPLDFI